MKPLYIFDLDGTLALIDHRRPLVELQPGSPVTVQGIPAMFIRQDERDPHDVWIEIKGTGGWRWSWSDVKFKPDWPAFFKACVFDKPNAPVIATLQDLHGAGNEIWIWSGRSDEVRAETEAWLKANVLADIGWLKMRKAGDYTPDDELKQLWFSSIADIDKARLCAVFDDRDRVVKMWRAKGVPCFQVAPGEF